MAPTYTRSQIGPYGAIAKGTVTEVELPGGITVSFVMAGHVIDGSPVPSSHAKDADARCPWVRVTIGGLGGTGGSCATLMATGPAVVNCT